MTKGTPPIERIRLLVRGVVQGVGFRPHVLRTAVAEGLVGRVANTTAGVVIEVQGPGEAVRGFPGRLRESARPPMRIDEVRVESVDVVAGEERFTIEPSVDVPGAGSLLPADLATCPECVEETLRLAGRRLGYPFTNCTACGPRFTIVRDVPYDRPATTMAEFVLCADCRREYEDPLDRRYHAEPIACPACGPRVRLRDPRGVAIASADPLGEAVRALGEGQVVALKGIGGYLLACDAADEGAVGRLRARKRRGNKPFALMAASLEVARAACTIDAAAEGFLTSPAAPILLLPRRAGSGVAAAVAPGQDHLGVMLPYSPLHHLLFAKGAPRLLVMTSGNRRDEPICTGEEAFDRLEGIADLYLDHDRPIWNRCDDSVGFVHRARLSLVRRARGYVPIATELPFDAVPALGIGGLFKGAICLVQGRRAVLGQHLGDTDAVETLEFLEEVRTNLSRWLRLEPEVVGCDPHPGYAVSALARRSGLPVEPVQHHHAHVAAGMVEAGLSGPAVGVALDGTGFGEDGTIWGGETLVCDYGGFRRTARLRPLPLPGGDAAIREPVRAALAYTAALGIGVPSDRVPAFAACDPALASTVRAAVRAPRVLRTSSAGRLFDAVGVLLGGPGAATFEGEVAMGLEVTARRALGGGTDPGGDARVPFAIVRSGDGTLEPDPAKFLRAAARALAGGLDDDGRARLALEFHRALAAAFARTAEEAAATAGLRDVVLSGGAMQNRLLLELLHGRLERAGLRVHVPMLGPANDGGLALGQAAVAAWRRRRTT
ncbi:MAG: carbamoyltransferase HypF [Deltaproteobacteria bacterium]|nr:carbamoyltransferase HypF [Deltaproteobacteria bacterium]